MDKEPLAAGEAPPMKAFLKRKQGRLGFQRTVQLPPEQHRMREQPMLLQARAPTQLAIRAWEDAASTAIAGGDIGSGGHTARREGPGECGRSTTSGAGTQRSLPSQGSGHGKRATLSSGGTQKVELAVQEAAAGSSAPSAYTAASKTALPVAEGILALHLVAGEAGAPSTPQMAPQEAGRHAAKRPGWDDRFWKAPSSGSSLMVSGIAGQWLKKAVMSGPARNTGTKRPGKPLEVARPGGVDTRQSSAAISRIALAAMIAKRDIARGKGNFASRTEPGSPPLARKQDGPPCSAIDALAHSQPRAAGAQALAGEHSLRPHESRHNGQAAADQQPEPHNDIPRTASGRQGKDNEQAALAGREGTRACSEAGWLQSSADVHRAPSSSAWVRPAGATVGVPLSAVLQRAGGLGHVLAAAAYEVDREAARFMDAIWRQRGAGAQRGRGAIAASAELRTLQAEMARETALAEGLAQLTDSLTQGSVRSGIARLERHLAAPRAGAGDELPSQLRHVAAAQLVQEVHGGRAGAGTPHGQRSGRAASAGPPRGSGSPEQGSGEGGGRGEETEEGSMGSGHSEGLAGFAGRQEEGGQGSGEERTNQAGLSPETAEAALHEAPLLREPAALYLRQLAAVEALEDRLRAKWLSDSSLIASGRENDHDSRLSPPSPAERVLVGPTDMRPKVSGSAAGCIAEPEAQLGSPSEGAHQGVRGSGPSSRGAGGQAQAQESSARHVVHDCDLSAKKPPAAQGAGAVSGVARGSGLGELLEVSAEQLQAWCSAAVDQLVDAEFRTPPATPKSEREEAFRPLARDCAA